jgi:hypothetical protein
MNDKASKSRYWPGLILKLIIVYNLASGLVYLLLFILKHYWGISSKSNIYFIPVYVIISIVFFGALVGFYKLVNRAILVIPKIKGKKS